MNRFAFVVFYSVTVASLAAQQPTATFDVASVKPLPAGSNVAGYRPEPTRFSAYFSVVEAIGFAYQIENNRIVDGPQWARDQRYEINATTPPRKPGDLNHMMRHLLEQRFALKLHRERRPMPVLSLALSHADGSLGPKLQRVQRDCARPVSNPSGCSFSFGVGRYRASGQEWKTFVGILETGITGRPILDTTGLSGQFDMTVEWNPDISRVPEAVINPPTLSELEARPVLFTAFREQLGLKLDSETAPIEVLVVDSVERPTPD
jgi:uncharacterized protein (TIGR03435 family)